MILGWGRVIVPGHGTVGGEAEVRTLQEYLRACADAGSIDAMADGPWSAWADQRFHPANVERAAMLAAGDSAPPPTILSLMGLA